MSASVRPLLWCCFRCMRAVTGPGTNRYFTRRLSSHRRALQLTDGLRAHLSKLLQRHKSLVQRATSAEAHQLSEEAHRELHRELSGLGQVSQLAGELEGKQQVSQRRLQCSLRHSV